MKTTVEISLYPLHKDYDGAILDFITRLDKSAGIEIQSNSMSTKVFGDFHDIMMALTQEMFTTLERYNAVFVMKVAQGDRKGSHLDKHI